MFFVLFLTWVFYSWCNSFWSLTNLSRQLSSQLYHQKKPSRQWTKESDFNQSYLADPGEDRGCSINSLVIPLFINYFSDPFPPTALQCRHAQTVRDSSSSYEIDYVIVINKFLNIEGHQNLIIGSKVTAIILKGWILPISWASAVEGLRSTLLPRLVFCMDYDSWPTRGWNMIEFLTILYMNGSTKHTPIRKLVNFFPKIFWVGSICYFC